MPRQRLLQTIEQLHSELADMEQVDAQTRAALGQVTDAIKKQLDDDPQAVEGESLGQQLQDFMLGIEADHPRLTRAVNQVADALANLGI